MPNIHISYTDNLPAQDQLEAFATALHTLITPVIKTEVGNFKTFITPVARYVSGDGQAKKAFLQIDFRMLPGRSDEVKKETANIILAQAAHFFSVENGIETRLIVEVGEIDQPNYYKTSINQ